MLARLTQPWHTKMCILYLKIQSLDNNMNPSSPASAHSSLQIRGVRASSVIVQRVPAAAVEAFMEWQHGITAAAAGFPGYQATEIYPPTSQHDEWVVIVHFNDAKSLQTWLESPRRAEWVARLPHDARDFRVKTVPAGFGAWFAGLGDEGGLPPHWKMALSILFGLYPTVMLLAIFLSPHTQQLGLAVSMLIGNAASVCFLEWVGSPLINPVIGPWLRANREEHRARSYLGAILIVLALALMTFLFYLVT